MTRTGGRKRRTTSRAVILRRGYPVAPAWARAGPLGRAPPPRALFALAAVALRGAPGAPPVRAAWAGALHGTADGGDCCKHSDGIHGDMVPGKLISCKHHSLGAISSAYHRPPPPPDLPRGRPPPLVLACRRRAQPQPARGLAAGRGTRA